ncbi:MAG: ABC transporter ATP-binding protein [Lachnospiraceae bacterium]|nr:ABC transporter ATP-binding protein [Lachnospiraceae bacterium]
MEGYVMQEFESVLEIKDLTKKFKDFELNIGELEIPKGFATALIGENGAGKTTLLNCLAGTRLDYKGEIKYFGKYVNDERENPENHVRESIGFTAPKGFFLQHWTVRQVGDICELLFAKFSKERFEQLCGEMGILEGNGWKKKVSELSDGNRMKLMLATAFARETKLLLMDEPTSPLDPLMRDKLCNMIREYLEKGQGESSALFSTHNISDMENVTDYCVFLDRGKVVEKGFVEDLKEKYVLIKGEKEVLDGIRSAMFDVTENRYGFEGICLAENLDQLAGVRLSKETPSLFQISVAILRQNASVR